MPQEPKKKVFILKNQGVGTVYNAQVLKIEDTLVDISKENTANKQNSLAVDGNGIKFPTVDAVNVGLDLKADKLFYKNRGTLTLTGTTVETRILLIPIGQVDINTILSISDMVFTSDYSGITISSGNAIIRIRLSDSTTLPTDENSIVTYVEMAANNNNYQVYNKLDLTYLFEGINETYFKCYTTALFTNNRNVFGIITANKFLHVTVQLPASTGNMTLRSCIINKL